MLTHHPYTHVHTTHTYINTYMYMKTHPFNTIKYTPVSTQNINFVHLQFIFI